MTGAPARCGVCGGELRMSHREYAGRGEQRLVLRCRGCGSTVTRAARAADEDRARRTSRRDHRPHDEGPPVNSVLDPDVARRLLEQMGPDD